jgi:prepilin-type N-terminal cleavage/methylation domain-containing protein
MRVRKQTQIRSGFSLVELLVAAAVGALLISAAVVGFGVIAQSPLRQGAINVSLPNDEILNFYGTNLPSLTLGANPNYFQAAKARLMKERLLADVASSSAVFCLGRNKRGNSLTRTNELVISNPYDFRNCGTPESFRQFLVSVDDDYASFFPENQDGAPTETTNLTIYAIGTLASILNYSNRLTVLATYELDFIPTANPPGGVFASVRRYSGTNTSVPTDYYHVYYPGETNGIDGFRPLAAFFSRADAKPSGVTDPFAIATNHPFAFVWWPDPLVARLGAGLVPASNTDSARANYTNMAGRTSLFFVLPAFPSL